MVQVPTFVDPHKREVILVMWDCLGQWEWLVTGILVLEKLVQGPKFLLKEMVPKTIFSGKIGPTLKILVPQKHPAKTVLP